MKIPGSRLVIEQDANPDTILVRVDTLRRSAESGLFIWSEGVAVHFERRQLVQASSTAAHESGSAERAAMRFTGLRRAGKVNWSPRTFEEADNE